MVKMDRMPTSLALLVFSWLIAVLGFAAGGFLMISGSGKINSVTNGILILLGSLLLATVIRMLGNIGQTFFEITGFVYGSLKTLNQQISALGQDISQSKETLNTTLLNINNELKTQFQSQNADIAQGFGELCRLLGKDLETLNQQISALGQDAKAAKEALNDNLININNELKSQFKSQNANLTQGLQELTRSVCSSLEKLQGGIDQISCDSKDIGQSIHQIKAFFEQIERHLDLKK